MGKHRKNRHFLESQRPNSDDMAYLDLRLRVDALIKLEVELTTARNEVSNLLYLDTISQDRRLSEILTVQETCELVDIPQYFVLRERAQFKANKKRNVFTLFIQVFTSLFKFFQRTSPISRAEESLNAYLKLRSNDPERLELSELLDGIDFDSTAYSRCVWEIQEAVLNNRINDTVKAIQKFQRILEDRIGEIRPKIRANYLIRNIRHDIRTILQFLFKPLEEPIYI